MESVGLGLKNSGDTENRAKMKGRKKVGNTKSNEKGEEGSEEIVENSQGLRDGRHDLRP